MKRLLLGLLLLVTAAASALAQPSGSVTPKFSTAAEASRVICTTGCSLYTATVGSGASAGFVLFYNATAAPANGAVSPVLCLPIAANSTISLPGWRTGLWFSTGLTVVFSTTGCFTQTTSATAFFSIGAL